MSNLRKLELKNYILSKTKCLGNTGQGLKNVCSDLLNNHIRSSHDLNEVCKGTFLCPSTIERMRTLEETKEGAPYRPQCETVERVLRYFGAEVTFKQVKIDPQFQNKEKNESN